MATLAELLKNLTPEQQHYIARLVASLPETEGGLNLPLSNTAMERAKLLGNTISAYTGTNKDLTYLDPNAGEFAREGTGVWTSQSPDYASTYAGRPGGNVMPLLIRNQNLGEVDWGGKNWQTGPQDAVIRAENFDVSPIEYGIDIPDTNDVARIARNQRLSGLRIYNVKDPGGHVRGIKELPKNPADNLVVFDPSAIRSKFAAFNPWRKGESDLLASHPLASAGAALAATGGLSGMARDYLSEPYDPGNQYAQFGLKPPMSKGEALKSAVSAVPGIGEVLSGAEGLQAASEGKWKEAGLGALGAAGLVPMGGIGGMINAYHGSPHAFDKFLMSKIGIGEGSQVKGHGLYVAEAENAARPYAFMANRAASRQGGLKAEGSNQATLDALIKMNARQFTGGDVGQLAQLIQRQPRAFSHPEQMIGRISEYIDNAPPAYMYDVELKWPNAAQEATNPLSTVHFMDWDLPFDQQPKSIQDLLKQQYQSVFDARTKTRSELQQKFSGTNKQINPEMSSITGQQLYDRLATELGGRPQASEYLNKQGIPGIRYLDQPSRAQGKGTYDYVLFDENIPSIIKRRTLSLSDIMR